MASIFQAFPQLRTAAPRLARQFFTCRQCSTKAPLRPSVPSFRPTTAQHRSILRTIRWQSTQAPKQTLESPIAGAGEATAKKSSFPQTSEKVVAYWLLGSAVSVFGIVVFGGLTRLTESGLSITEWRPVTGSLPPMNAEDWESEFSKYRASPEFRLLNPNMTLSEFKQIYWMEWTHRLWGRVIGLTFLVPTAYFIARRKVSASMAVKLTGICAMIGFQGFIGWWMVASGLKDDLFAPGSHPRVSQYRLAAHLGAAFVVYVSMLSSGLSILRERKFLAAPEEALKKLNTLRHPHLRLFRGSVVGTALLVFTTAMSGALVAGLDAGLIYNEFPYMGVGLAPPKKELFDPFYSRKSDQSDLWWRNMLENPSLVQLDHRILAMSTFTTILSLFAYTRYSSKVRAVLPRDAKKGVTGLVHTVWMQAALGISTLIYMVPTWLASAHQAGALALLTCAAVLYSRIRMPRRAIMETLMKHSPKHQSQPTLRARMGNSEAQQK